ncbi:MAG: hypothetical protein F4059_00485 [Gemmatimonadetes bacterium]|nr:hypothetical protein [Gemmatimonadota bacterium]
MGQFRLALSSLGKVIKSLLHSVKQLNRILIRMSLLSSAPGAATIGQQLAIQLLKDEVADILVRQGSATRDIGLQRAVHGPYSLFRLPF